MFSNETKIPDVSSIRLDTFLPSHIDERTICGVLEYHEIFPDGSLDLDLLQRRNMMMLAVANC